MQTIGGFRSSLRTCVFHSRKHVVPVADASPHTDGSSLRLVSKWRCSAGITTPSEGARKCVLRSGNTSREASGTQVSCSLFTPDEIFRSPRPRSPSSRLALRPHPRMLVTSWSAATCRVQASSECLATCRIRFCQRRDHFLPRTLPRGSGSRLHRPMHTVLYCCNGVFIPTPHTAFAIGECSS